MKRGYLLSLIPFLLLCMGASRKEAKRSEVKALYTDGLVAGMEWNIHFEYAHEGYYGALIEIRLITQENEINYSYPYEFGTEAAEESLDYVVPGEYMCEGGLDFSFYFSIRTKYNTNQVYYHHASNLYISSAVDHALIEESPKKYKTKHHIHTSKHSPFNMTYTFVGAEEKVSTRHAFGLDEVQLTYYDPSQMGPTLTSFPYTAEIRCLDHLSLFPDGTDHGSYRSFPLTMNLRSKNESTGNSVYGFSLAYPYVFSKINLQMERTGRPATGLEGKATDLMIPLGRGDATEPFHFQIVLENMNKWGDSFVLSRTVQCPENSFGDGENSTWTLEVS